MSLVYIPCVSQFFSTAKYLNDFNMSMNLQLCSCSLSCKIYKPTEVGLSNLDFEINLELFLKEKDYLVLTMQDRLTTFKSKSLALSSLDMLSLFW